MTPSSRPTAVLLVAGVLVLAGGPAHAEGVWTTVPTPNPPGSSVLWGADASDTAHVWAVGRLRPRTGTGLRSVILRHDGVSWRPVVLSGSTGNDTLFDVDAVSGTEAWAVGASYRLFSRTGTLVARWDGSAWTQEATPNANPAGVNTLSGVAAAGGTTWAVGNYLEPGTYASRALVLQRTGGTWRISTAPRVLATEFLHAVDATGPADAWAVGSGSDDNGSGAPVALRWNGSTWRSMPPPGAGATALSAVEALTPTDVWAAGYARSGTDGDQPYVARFDGTSWRRVATPTISGGGRLTDIVALSATNIVAVGTVGTGTSLVLHWDGSAWTREAVPGAVNLNGAAAAGPDRFWAVGSGFDLGAYEDRGVTVVRR
jgi:hypothetical protein